MPALSVGHDMMDVVTANRSVDLVGRDAELEELCSRLGIAASADGLTARTTSVLLAGDAGVGKTRLLSELRDRALTAGWHVVAGHCVDLSDSALPYLPFSEILGLLAGTLPEVAGSTLADQPVLQRLQPGRRVRTSTEHADESPLERADLFEAMHALLERAAGEAPILVVVEDAHWADQSTRDLLSFLFSRGFAAPVGLVVSYRSDDLHRRHPLRRQVAQWSRLPVVRMQLEPLGASEVRQLVHVLHPDPIAERDVADIVERAEGNAFFVEELVGAARVTGGVPADLADLLLVRLERLDDGAQQVVRTAAVAGRKVSHALLAAVSGLGEQELDEALRTAVERHVLEPVGGDAYSFRHALLAEAVYDDLLPGERVRRHAAYARVLQSGAVPGTSAELARHARLGQDVATALRASIDAGDEAMRVGGPEEASQHYELAMQLLDHPATREAAPGALGLAELAMRTADALTAAGHAHRANALLAETLQRLPAGSSDIDRGLLTSQLALSIFTIEDEGDELELARRAVALLSGGTEAQRARSLANQARILAGHLREDEARRVGAEALAMSQRLDLPRLSADILTTLASLQRHQLGDDVGDALADVIGQARSSGAVHAELRGLYGLGRFHQDRGEMDEALALFETCRARGVQIGTPWAPYSFDALVMSGSVQFVTGRWEDALRTAGQARNAPAPLVAGVLRGLEATVAAARGERVATQLVAELRPLWSGEGLVGLFAATAELELAEQSADSRGALGTYARAVEVLGAMWRDLFQARLRLAALTLGVLGTASRQESGAERIAAQATADRLLSDGRRVVAHTREDGLVFGPEALAWIQRLEAEHLRWRWLAQIDPPAPDELREAWEQTEAAFVRYGHVHELARVRARLSDVLRGLGEPELAREAGDLARAAAHSLGAQPLLGELTALGSAPVAGRAEQVGLTPRESEILALVAEGRSNGEIGQQLFIATKTVSVHVSNILAKLGAASRTEAAALARRRGLIG
ncbi:helix-turn-helix transcriptional regulator [Nocardioides houyundeii]|uniref:helix-turn-helix transcriptional regulator n=1 Tax=Nocardioides houyundeii TaxID=2045452 RepID=UPI000C790988|nr:AAA family ATPase [Nocardioides houyundeii]